MPSRNATDFDDFAFFHAEYSRLLAHWREVLPLRILDMRYEDTIADPERQVRQPIYASSVGRWQRYAPFLGSELDRLPVE